MTSATTWRLAFLVIQGGSSVVLFAALGHLLSEGALAATAVAQGVIVIAQSVGDFGLSQAAVAVLPARIAAGDVSPRNCCPEPQLPTSARLPWRSC